MKLYLNSVAPSTKIADLPGGPAYTQHTHKQYIHNTGRKREAMYKNP